MSHVKSRRANNNKMNDFLIPFRCSGSKSLLLHMSPSWLTRIINGTKPSLMLLATLVRFMLNNESNVCWGKKGGLCVHAGSAGALTWDKAFVNVFSDTCGFQGIKSQNVSKKSSMWSRTLHENEAYGERLIQSDL